MRAPGLSAGIVRELRKLQGILEREIAELDDAGRRHSPNAWSVRAKAMFRSRLPFRRKACPECGGTGHVTPHAAQATRSKMKPLSLSCGAGTDGVLCTCLGATPARASRVKTLTTKAETQRARKSRMLGLGMPRQ